jgi:hypothetical protein
MMFTRRYVISLKTRRVGERVMTAVEQKVTDIVKDGQSGKYKNFVRSFTGRVTKVLKLKNPLIGSILVDDIDRLIEIVNPDLQGELTWLKELQAALKLWVNDMIISNRLLGLKNDNEFDITVFENVVMEKFYFQLKEKPKPGTPVETDFKTMVELVELGARRFGV